MGDCAAQYRRGSPLPTTEAVRRAIEGLLGSANQRQVWIFFFDVDGAIVDPIMPVDGLPGTPGKVVDTDDLGRVCFAQVFSDRVQGIAEMIGAASCGLVWERRGGGRPTTADFAWAGDMAHYLAKGGVILRAQFLLHNQGLDELRPATVSPK